MPSIVKERLRASLQGLLATIDAFHETLRSAAFLSAGSDIELLARNSGSLIVQGGELRTLCEYLCRLDLSEDARQFVLDWGVLNKWCLEECFNWTLAHMAESNPEEAPRLRQIHGAFPDVESATRLTREALGDVVTAASRIERRLHSLIGLLDDTSSTGCIELEAGENTLPPTEVPTAITQNRVTSEPEAILYPGQVQLTDGTTFSSMPEKQVLLLKLLDLAGPPGIHRDDLCKKLGYGIGEKANKALNQLAHRVNKQIHRAQFTIQAPLSHGTNYCLKKV